MLNLWCEETFMANYQCRKTNSKGIISIKTNEVFRSEVNSLRIDVYNLSRNWKV